MFRYLVSIISLLFIITSPCMGDIASSGYVNRVRDNVQAKIDNKADNANYTQNMVLQTDNSGNVVATTVGTDLLADGAIQTMHLADGAVTNADLAGMIDITKLNLGTLPTSGKHIMIWNAKTNEYVFEKLNNGLPDGYTRLEYIESTGTQYIDTGYAYKNEITQTQVKFAFTNNTIPGRNLFGCGRYDDNYITAYQNDPTFLGIYACSGQKSAIRTTDYGQHTIDVSTPSSVGSDLYITIDGVKQSYKKNASNVSNTHMGLFTQFDGMQTSMYLSRLGSYKVYSFTMVDAGTIMRNFVPAKRSSDGVIGMYDTVTETFFTNAGTGNFIAGPEI